MVVYINITQSLKYKCDIDVIRAFRSFIVFLSSSLSFLGGVKLCGVGILYCVDIKSWYEKYLQITWLIFYRKTIILIYKSQINKYA